MKASFLLSIAALIAAAAAQSSEPVVSPPVDTNIAAPSVVMQNSSVPITGDNIGKPADLNDELYSQSSSSSSSKFVAWSSSGYRGHKQTTKSTSGCYKLSGGAVGSFEGKKDMQYGFYKDSKCGDKLLYSSKDSRVRKIDPIIRPRSVKILNKGSDSSRRSLVAWSRTKYSGDKQTVYGKGCKSLNGKSIRSYEGKYNYKFYEDRNCFGKKLLQSRGGKSSTKKINPRSVYIYEN
ncbi:hypothetical protein BGX28_005330 [Mortierella sp. GBA30]|nr:hypothetical protein BGX28_005330 [Mortierella sp. GBA30]